MASNIKVNQYIVLLLLIYIVHNFGTVIISAVTGGVAATLVIIILSNPQVNDEFNNLTFRDNLRKLIIDFLDPSHVRDSQGGHISSTTVDLAIQCDNPFSRLRHGPFVGADTESLLIPEVGEESSEHEHISKEQKEVENGFTEDDDDDDVDEFLLESLQINSRGELWDSKLNQKIVHNGEKRQQIMQNVDHLQNILQNVHETLPKCGSVSSVSLEEDSSYLSLIVSDDEDPSPNTEISLCQDKTQCIISLAALSNINSDEGESFQVSLHSSPVLDLISQTESPPEDHNRDDFSHVLDAYYAIYNNSHLLTFISGCLIHNTSLDVLISNNCDLQECYQQVINVIPWNVKHLVNVKFISEAILNGSLLR